MAAIDLRGEFRAPYAYWDASSGRPAERLRADLELLPMIAGAGWSQAAKDISMAGVVGTALMLFECSGIGAHIALDHIPRPKGVSLPYWLTVFSSYGFLLSVPGASFKQVLACFGQRDITVAVIGRTDQSRKVTIGLGDAFELLWDLDQQPFIGCTGQTKMAESHDNACANFYGALAWPKADRVLLAIDSRQRLFLGRPELFIG